MNIYSLRDWLSVLVALITAFVTVLTFLRARKLGGWKAFSSDPSAEIEAETEKFKQLVKEGLPEGTPESRQYLLLREYHAQGIAQSKISFWFSLVFAAIGFGVIVMGLLTLQADKEFSKQAGSLVTMLAGTIIDAVSALFFVQSNKARQLMSEFFDKLRIDRKLEESLRLCGEIQHSTVMRDRVRALIALNFSDVKPKEELVAAILGIEMPTSPLQNGDQLPQPKSNSAVV